MHLLTNRKILERFASAYQIAAEAAAQLEDRLIGSIAPSDSALA